MDEAATFVARAQERRAERMAMTGKELDRFRNLLLVRRRELFGREASLGAGRDELMDREIEVVEDAQKLAITEPYDRIDEAGKNEIEQIDLALRKIPLGDYGICENCGDEIPVKRLEALPWARLCVDCASDFEKKGLRLRAPTEVLSPAAVQEEETIEPNLPDEYQGLSEKQIVRRVMRRLESDGRIETDELELSIKDGVLFLEGMLHGAPEHQILMQTLTDVLGFSSVVDHLKIDRFRRDDRTARKATEGAAMEDKLFYQEEELTEDLYESSYQDDDNLYTPPEKPLPRQEGESPG